MGAAIAIASAISVPFQTFIDSLRIYSFGRRDCTRHTCRVSLGGGAAFLDGTRGAGDRADDRPVVLVDRNRLLRLRPEINRDVVVAVAQDAGLDGQVAHALAQP